MTNMRAFLLGVATGAVLIMGGFFAHSELTQHGCEVRTSSHGSGYYQTGEQNNNQYEAQTVMTCRPAVLIGSN